VIIVEKSMETNRRKNYAGIAFWEYEILLAKKTGRAEELVISSIES